MIRYLFFLFTLITSRCSLFIAVAVLVSSQFYHAWLTMPVMATGEFVVVTYHHGWLFSHNGTLSGNRQWSSSAYPKPKQPTAVTASMDVFFGMPEDQMHPWFDRFGVTVSEPESRVVAVRHWVVIAVSGLYFLAVQLLRHRLSRNLRQDSDVTTGPPGGKLQTE